MNITNDENMFKSVIELMNKDAQLTDEMRERYVGAVNKLAIGQKIEAELGAEIMLYIDNLFTEAEDDAVAREDKEMIKLLAELRRERDLIASAILTDGSKSEKSEEKKEAKEEVVAESPKN
jgi:hypothetical protein